MKPRYRMAIGMFLIVVAAGAVSAGIFVVQGSEAAVYAQLGIIPLLLLVGYVWVNRTVQSSGTSRSEFERRKARKVGEAFGDLWHLAGQVDREYEMGITETEWDLIHSKAADLESSGISFDMETATFDVDNREMGSLEDINRLENDILDLHDRILSEFTRNVRDRVENVNGELERLDGLVAEIQPPDPSDIPEAQRTNGPSWRETGGSLEACYEEADRVVENACRAVENALANTDDVEDEEVTSQLSAARQSADRREYRQAVTQVLEVRDAVEHDIGAGFDRQRQGLETLIRTVSDTDFERYLGSGYDERLRGFRNELEEFDDAMRIAQLQEFRDEVRSCCVEIVDDLQEEVDGFVAQLEDADIPEGWYDQPATTGEDYVVDLQNSDDLGSFTDSWERACEMLLADLAAVKPKADVVSGYDRIESQIDEQLRAEGTVTGEDLPVTEHQEQFLGLYYRKHMERVEFDPSVPLLSAGGDGEQYDVHVTVTFPEGGSERELTISITGEKENASAELETPLVAETTFEELPFGEYTVRIDPADDEFAAIEETHLVDSDLTLEFDLEQMGLRERLCEGLDVDVDKVLERLSDRFDDRFAEEGYVDTNDSFPVDESYIPCLLAVWAERNGHELAERGDSLVVYDRDQLRKEIENVIRYNMEPGDSKHYDELRENFLSAPVSNGTVRELIDESSEREAVTLEETRLTRKE